MNTESQVARVTELRVLAASENDPDYFRRALAAGLNREAFASSDTQVAFDCIAQSYEATPNVAPDHEALLLRCTGPELHVIDRLPEMYVTAVHDPEQVVPELLRLANSRKVAGLRTQAKAAMSRDEATKAHALLEAAAELEERAATGKVLRFSKRSSIEWVETAKIFEPLPPTKWVARGLMIGPGRPTMLAGYGASAKTLVAQQTALAVASGQQILGHFECVRGVVLHADFEQGFHASAKKYQRLAIGHGIDTPEIGDRLRLSALPRVFLSSDDAVDAYSRATEGVDLLIVDSFRAATPGHDENDSKVREFIDVLTRVSESTGVACMLIHHAGKGGPDKSADARQHPRGSSGIFDACGAVLNIVAGATGTDPRHVSMTKAPAEAEGGLIEPFDLVVEDVAIGTDRTAGVRVLWREVEQADPDAKAKQQIANDRERLLRVITAEPGSPQEVVCLKAQLNKTRACGVLAVLEHEKLVRVVPGAKNAKTYWPVVTP